MTVSMIVCVTSRSTVKVISFSMVVGTSFSTVIAIMVGVVFVSVEGRSEVVVILSWVLT